LSTLREAVIYPPSQIATSVNPWKNARRVPSVALAKDDTLRRVAPDEACGGCHGRKPVGLHFLTRKSKNRLSKIIRILQFVESGFTEFAA
jgi:hypothetical protein